jgi:hypothetical protein
MTRCTVCSLYSLSGVNVEIELQKLANAFQSFHPPVWASFGVHRCVYEARIASAGRSGGNG